MTSRFPWVRRTIYFGTVTEKKLTWEDTAACFHSSLPHSAQYSLCRWSSQLILARSSLYLFRSLMSNIEYLKSALQKWLLLSNNGQMKIEGFTDADWVGSLDDRRLTSSYCTSVAGDLDNWRCKKKMVVARSNAKVEYRAVVLGVCEVL